MFSLNDNTLGANGTFTQRVQMLVIGRLVVIFLLLVTSWIWSSGSAQFSLQSIPQGPLLVFIISVGLTVVYFFLIRISTDLHWQIRAQFIIDALLITWLVWRTGDMTSPYITLYIVLIGISSIFMRPVSTIAMAVLCVCLFIALTLLAVFDVLQTGAPPQDDPCTYRTCARCLSRRCIWARRKGISRCSTDSQCIDHPDAGRCP